MKGIGASRVAFALATFFMFLSGVCAESTQGTSPPTSFEECVAQQGKVLKSYPARCVTVDGVTFVDSTAAERGEERPCKDLCGDGRCQEIVCMAVGCPCSESPASCPKDCKQ